MAERENNSNILEYQQTSFVDDYPSSYQQLPLWREEQLASFAILGGQYAHDSEPPFDRRITDPRWREVVNHQVFSSKVIFTDAVREQQRRGKEALAIFPDEEAAIQQRVLQYQRVLGDIYGRIKRQEVIDGIAPSAYQYPNAWHRQQLTALQHSLLYLSFTGMTNDRMAETIRIPLGAMKGQLQTATKRLDAHTREDAVAKAISAGLIDLHIYRERGNLEAYAYLTTHEREVFGEVAAIGASYSTSEIAERLRISERSVKNHLSNILLKLGLSRRIQLILFKFQYNIRDQHE